MKVSNKGNWYEHDDDRRIRGKQPSEFVLIRTLLPRTCLLSNKIIYPFRKAWRRQYFHYYNDLVAFEHWISNEEMLFAKLKGKHL